MWSGRPTWYTHRVRLSECLEQSSARDRRVLTKIESEKAFCVVLMDFSGKCKCSRSLQSMSSSLSDDMSDIGPTIHVIR